MSTHRTVTAINLASSVGVRLLAPEEVTPELEAAAAEFLLKLQEIWNDNNLSPEERERIYAALVPLAAAVPAVGAVLGFHLPPVGEVAS